MSAVATSAGRGAGPTAESGGRLVVNATYAAALAAGGLNSVASLFTLSDGQRLGKASLPSWRERIRFELPGAGTLYLKRYVSPPVGQQLGRILAGYPLSGTARIEWDRMRDLEAAGIASVKRVALAEEMAGVWERRSALVAAAVPGESLERYVRRRSGRLPPELIRESARFVARFHRTGWVHRDLYLSHIFMETVGERTVFRLIDLARVFRPRWRRRRWMVKELASLNYSTPPGSATATDRLRFLKTYLGREHFSPADRRLIRQVARKTARIARHDVRRSQGEGRGP